MPIQTRLSISTQDFNKGMKNAANTANSTLGGIQKGSKAAQTAVDGIGRTASSMAGTAGRAVSTVTSTLSKMGPVGLTIAGVFAGITLAIAGVVKGLTSLAGKIDGVAKSAKSIGMSVNGMLATKFAAGRSGMDFNRTIDSIQKLENAWEKATKGEKKYIDMFKELGVDMSKDWTIAPERLYGSVTSALATGRRSSTLEELLGRRGIREANKAGKNFDKDLRLASTMGIEFPENAIANAERLTTATGELSDAFLTMLSRTKLLSDGMEALAKVEEHLVATTNSGRPLAENDSYENLYNVLEQALEKDEKGVVKAYLDSIHANEDIFNEASEKDIEDFVLAIRKLKPEALARFVETFDKRFDSKNQDTWVQTKQDARTQAEIDRDNEYRAVLFNIRGGARLDEQLNKLKQKQIELTQEQIDALEEEVRQTRAKKWGDVYDLVSRDLIAVGSEKIKQELSIEGINESAMKYIESTAKALLGDNGLQQLYARHGGTAEGFLNAYQEGRLFTPFAEDSLSEQTRKLMQDRGLSFNEEGIKAAEEYAEAQIKSAQASRDAAAESRKQIEANKAAIASSEAERAEKQRNSNASNTLANGTRKVTNAIYEVGTAVNKSFVSFLAAGDREKKQEFLDSEKNKKNSFEIMRESYQGEANEAYAKAISLTAQNEELEAQAKKEEEAAEAQLKAAEEMQKAVKEMKSYYEAQNIDKEIQDLLRQAEAIDYAKLLNAQVDLAKQLKGQGEEDYWNFRSGGNRRTMARAQAISQLRNSGLPMDEPSIRGLAEDIYKAQRERDKVNIQRMMQQQYFSNEDWMMGKGGARGAGMKAVAEAVRAFGDSLSEAQRDLIGRSAEMKFNIDNWQQAARTGTMFKTNELTSRGGFRTGAAQTQRDNLRDVISNQKRYITMMESLNLTNKEIARLLTN